MSRLALCLGVALLALSFGCTPTGAGRDLQLDGGTAEAFRKLVGHDAVTVSERITIYGGENPPSAQLQCHENQHKAQAAVIADALVSIGALEDEELTRMAAWLAVYGIDYAVYGYDNRFERGAREACAKAP